MVLQTALGGALVALPLAAFQWHGFREFCRRGPPEQLPAWCSAAVPYLYGHVQAHYWGVGFLRYFRIEQVQLLVGRPPNTLVRDGSDVQSRGAHDQSMGCLLPCRCSPGVVTKLILASSLLHIHGALGVSHLPSLLGNAGCRVCKMRQSCGWRVQVPNFLLAAPILGLSFWGCATFIREHGLPTTLHSLFTPGMSASTPSAAPLHCACDVRCTCAFMRRAVTKKQKRTKE